VLNFPSRLQHHPRQNPPGSRLRTDRAALEATLRKDAVLPAGHADTPAAVLAVAAAAPTTAAPPSAVAAAVAAPPPSPPAAAAAFAVSPAALAALHARARGDGEAEVVDAAAAPDASVVAAALASQLQGPGRRRQALAINVDPALYAAVRRQLAPLLDGAGSGAAAAAAAVSGTAAAASSPPSSDNNGGAGRPYAIAYQARARTLLLRRNAPGGAKAPRLPGTLAVVCGGGGDLAAAEAARAVAEHLGCYVLAPAPPAPGARPLSADVAAARRLLGPALEAADAVVVVAGHDPCLPAAVAAMTEAPVVALPVDAAGAAAAAASPGVVSVGVAQPAAAAAAAARVLRVAAARVGRMLAAQQARA